MPEAHARLFGGSVMDRRITCPGSARLEDPTDAVVVRTSSVYADYGTDCHTLAERCLTLGKNPADFAGMLMPLGNNVDPEMIDLVQVYVDLVRDMTGPNGALFVERRVHFGPDMGIPDGDGFGTADAIIVLADELIVTDLKTGRGVQVDAERNAQLMSYAVGAVRLIEDLMGDAPSRVRLVISQPAISAKPSEWDLCTSELLAWAAGEAREAVDVARKAMTFTRDAVPAEFFNPTEKGCKFCSAKATCPALRDEIHGTVFGGPVASPEDFGWAGNGVPPAEMLHANMDAAQEAEGDAQYLAACLSKVDLIEDWCKAVRAEAERRLLAGEEVPGFKIVQGKRGARQWADPAEAERLLREVFRLPIEKAYDLKLISPTTAEQLAKAGDIGPRQWPKAQALITQREGAPHVAPITDPRPALDVKPCASEFDVVSDLA